MKMPKFFGDILAYFAFIVLLAYLVGLTFRAINWAFAGL